MFEAVVGLPQRSLGSPRRVLGVASPVWVVWATQVCGGGTGEVVFGGWDVGVGHTGVWGCVGGWVDGLIKVG